MNTLRVLYHLALADFIERTRRYSFLLILGIVVLLGVLVNNGTLAMTMGTGGLDSLVRFRGELNSAWIGAMTVMVTNTFLGLFGFYLVSDTIKRDIRTGVGQIIATTPVSRALYLVGKWISNAAVLAVLVLILAAAAVIMVLLNRQAALDLGALLMPFLAVALPNMVLTAALAVVFETVPWLRGALGSVIYFFLWSFALVTWNLAGTKLPFLIDPIGYRVFGTSIYASARAAFPNDTISNFLSVGNYNLPGTQYKSFSWLGPEWTAGNVGGQCLWVIIGAGLILASALWFARFDPSREGISSQPGKPGRTHWIAEIMRRIQAIQIELPALSALVSKLAGANPFLGVLIAELRLLLKGRRWWWWAVLVSLSIALFTNQPSIAEQFLLPAVWLWPLAIWSEMGSRERKNNTSQLVFSSARPVLRQLPAAWLAGVLATALFSIALPVFFLSKGDLTALAGWVGAVLFVPSLALALGVFSSGSRVFEVAYVIWWYVGPLQKTAGLDFISGPPQVFLLAAGGLLLLSAFWRERQVRV